MLDHTGTQTLSEPAVAQQLLADVHEGIVVNVSNKPAAKLSTPT